MITLTIYFADGSVRWTEHFNDPDAAAKWIADEKTRPYWDASWIVTFEESKNQGGS